MITIKTELNTIFETLGLLYSSRHQLLIKDEMIRRLNEIGIEGELFYNQQLHIIEPYIEQFKQQEKHHQNLNFFFEDYNNNFFLFLTRFLMDYLENPMITEDTTLIQNRIINFFNPNSDMDTTSLTNLEDRYHFINTLELEDVFKWKLLTILNQPNFWMNELKEIYDLNSPIYEMTIKNFTPLLNNLFNTVSGKINETLEALDIPHCASVGYYSFVLPLVQYIDKHLIIYGIVNDKLDTFTETKQQSKENILPKLKILSDKSKFEILCYLKESPKYNLELAEKLSLSAATVSHHMNILLAAKLVKVHKTEGKVYYSIEKSEIENLFDTIKYYLV